MLKIENFEVVGWEHAIRGMRNPMNSWGKSDSEKGCEIVNGSHEVCRECDHAVWIGSTQVCPNNDRPDFVVGYNDRTLMMNLAKGGPVHAKYRRMIAVYLDVTAPLYWWKEFDTYKVGVVRNSCSTMHKIHSKMFDINDFSYEHLMYAACVTLSHTIDDLNQSRRVFLHGGELCDKYGNWTHFEPGDKKVWWQMIQLLPSSYNQRATLMLNYEVLVGIYRDRKNHKLDEWHVFCDWISELPYSELIIGSRDDVEERD